MLDAALQTLSAGLFDARSPACYLPVNVDEVWTRDIGAPADWLAGDDGQWTMHAELTRREGELIEGSVWIFGRGTLIGYMRNVRAIRALQSASARRRRAAGGGDGGGDSEAGGTRRSSDGE